MQQVLRVLHTLRSRVVHDGSERLRIGALGGDDPRPSRSVETDGDAGLTGYRTQLGHGRSRTASHRQRQPGVGEQRMPGGAGGARHERYGPFRQAGRGQGRIERMGHDGLGGAQRIRTDAEHHGVAAAEHAGGVGEHVGTAFEDESHHAEPGAHLFDPPPVMRDGFHDGAAARCGVAPGAEPGNHVGPHLLGEDQPRGGTAFLPGTCHVGRVGGGDGGE